MTKKKKATLPEKIKKFKTLLNEKTKTSEKPEADSEVKKFRKLLKRAQRKLRLDNIKKKKIEDRKAKKEKKAA